jgi:hypothetical protein
MRVLEAEQLAEERSLLNGEAATVPSSPLRNTHVSAIAAEVKEKPAPIGPPAREGAGIGAKSMPASRRTSGSAGTFGLEKLSLSVMAGNGKKVEWNDEDVDAEGAQSEWEFVPNEEWR